MRTQKEILTSAADEFDRWMKDFEESHREFGHYDNANKALIDFLDGDRGFALIKTYEQFCQLADLVRQKGYTTTNPPCTPMDFREAILKADPKSFADQKPVMPEEATLPLAAFAEAILKAHPESLDKAHAKEERKTDNHEEDAGSTFRR